MGVFVSCTNQFPTIRASCGQFRCHVKRIRGERQVLDPTIREETLTGLRLNPPVPPIGRGLDMANRLCASHMHLLPCICLYPRLGQVPFRTGAERLDSVGTNHVGTKEWSRRQYWTREMPSLVPIGMYHSEYLVLGVGHPSSRVSSQSTSRYGKGYLSLEVACLLPLFLAPRQSAEVGDSLENNLGSDETLQ